MGRETEEGKDEHEGLMFFNLKEQADVHQQHNADMSQLFKTFMGNSIASYQVATNNAIAHQAAQQQAGLRLWAELEPLEAAANVIGGKLGLLANPDYIAALGAAIAAAAEYLRANKE